MILEAIEMDFSADALMVVVLLPGADIRAVGGSVRSRNVRAAARAGAVVADPAAVSALANQRVVVVPPGVLINPSLFGAAAEIDVPTVLESGARAAVLVTSAGAMASSTRERTASDIMERGDVPRRQAPPGALFDVSSPRARRRATWSILKSTAKPSDGWIARRFNRPVSRLVSFVLLRLGLRAWHASALALLVGFAGAVVGSLPGFWPFVGLGVLFHLASVFDGVDGEVARSTLTESEAGARLDVWVDSLTYLVCLAGLTVGWLREGAGQQVLLWAAAVIVAVVATILRGEGFLARHAPNAPQGKRFALITRTVRQAARTSDRRFLVFAARGFTLLHRDVYAALFLLASLSGSRAAIPLLICAGILIPNFVLSQYRRELAAAVATETASGY
jgi:phosphatidylglycerophosphate synthase